jgi:hypothetical protein
MRGPCGSQPGGDVQAKGFEVAETRLALASHNRMSDSRPGEPSCAA